LVWQLEAKPIMQNFSAVCQNEFKPTYLRSSWFVKNDFQMLTGIFDFRKGVKCPAPATTCIFAALVPLFLVPIPRPQCHRILGHLPPLGFGASKPVILAVTNALLPSIQSRTMNAPGLFAAATDLRRSAKLLLKHGN